MTLALASHNESAIYEFGMFRLDLGVRQLFHGDEPIRLPSRTFDILRILVENRGEITTKSQLMREVWPGETIEESNLTVRMAALRKALNETRENRFIETITGSGYRFVARVRVATNGSDAQQSVPSIAILPFSNNTDLERLNYICDGVTEALIASLSLISDLRVMARSTVFRHKQQNPDLLKLGKELSVQTLLVSRVGLVNGQLEFDLEMIDAADGAYLWGAKYLRRVDDLVSLQEELAREISEQLRLKLTRSEKRRIAKSHTSNSEAHLLYLKGRYFWNQRSLPGIRKAISYFRRAVKIDPLYALSFAGLADCYTFVAGAELQAPKRAIPKAKAAALKAISLDGELAEPRVTLGNIMSSYELNWKDAEREFQLAIRLNPYYAPAYFYYANLLTKFGQFDRALTEIHKAYMLDPVARLTNLMMGKIYYFARRYDQAIDKAYEIFEAHPQFGLARGLIGLSYLEMGRFREALQEFQLMRRSLVKDAQPENRKSKIKDSDPEPLAWMGYAYALDGKRTKALQMLGQLEKLAQQKYVEPLHLAVVHVGLGNINQAFDLLDRAVDQQVGTLSYIKVWPMMDRLRHHPRYRLLVRRLGLDAT